MIILLLLSIIYSFPQQQVTDQYLKDWNEAKRTGKPWLVIIGSDSCGPCIRLEKLAKTKGIIVTKLDYRSKHAKRYQEFYRQQNKAPVSSFPDWLLLRSDKKNWVHVKRYRNYVPSEVLDSRIRYAKNAKIINYSPE